MKDKMCSFLQGRYGVDALSKCLLGVGLVAVIQAAFLEERLRKYIVYPWMGCNHLLLFPYFSKNITEELCRKSKVSRKDI